MPATPFIAARDFLFAHRADYETAYRDFRWPVLDGAPRAGGARLSSGKGISPS